jgi:hypothetical protein
MAAPALVETDRTIGLEVARALWKDDRLKPSAALWLYDEDAGEWRFVIATGDVHTRGPRAAYLRMRGILKRAGFLDELPLRRVVLWDPSHPILAALRRIVRLPDDRLASASVYDSTVGSTYVAGALVYFLIDPGADIPLAPGDVEHAVAARS